MNKAILPILARLHSLQTASRLLPEGGRIIASRSDPQPITVILREINETVLGRALHFMSESGLSLSIDVAGRRILRVTDAQGLPRAETCLAASVLEDEHKDDLIKLMLAFAQPRHEIRLSSRTSIQGSDGVSVGLPVALIADLLLVELNGLDAELPSDAGFPPPLAKSPEGEEPTPEVAPVRSATKDGSVMGRFARGNGSVLMAWLISGGEEDGVVEGPEEMVDHLRSFLDDELGDLGAQLDRISAAPGDPVCLCLGAKLDSGHSILCARADGAILLGLAEGDCLQPLMSAWSTALA